MVTNNLPAVRFISNVSLSSVNPPTNDSIMQKGNISSSTVPYIIRFDDNLSENVVLGIRVFFPCAQ